MEAAEIDQHLTELEERLEKLRVLYDQYFSGIERFEPARKREDVERRIKNLRREHIRNTGQRFKFQQVVQRYTTFAQYWTRILREIEKGTFKRDLARAAKRFGTANNKKKTSQQELEQAALKAAESDEPEELDSSWIEEAEEEVEAAEDPDEDTSPFRRSELDLPPAAPPPAAPAAPAAARPAPVAVPAPVPSRPAAPAPRAPLPSAPQAVAPVAAASPAPLPAPAAATPAPAPVAAAATPAPPAAAKRPALAPTRLDLDDDDLLGGGQPSPRLSPRPASAPQATPRPAAVAAPSQPRPSTTTPPAPQPSGPLASAPQPTSQPRPAAQPSSVPQPRAAVPSGPTSQPRPALPREEPVEVPAAAAQLPRTPAHPRPRQGDDLDDGRIRDIYNRYVEAKRRCNESTAAITLDGLSKSLRDSVPKLQQKHGGRVVDFEVVVKDGKTVLKPVVKAT